MNRAGALAAVVVGGLLLAACTGSHAGDACAGHRYCFDGGTAVGTTITAADREKAGGFTGELVNGGKLSLSQSAGKVTVINFWATWCGPCTVETPQLDQVYRADKAEGVAFIGIDTHDYSSDAVKVFIRDYDISYPMVSDEEGETAVALGKIPALSLPFTVLIDRHQRVAAVYLHVITAKDLQPVLTGLLAES